MVVCALLKSEESPNTEIFEKSNDLKVVGNARRG